MPKRKMRLVKQTPPIIAICERCNSQFKADSSQDAEAKFSTHKCKPLDSSQNSLRIVREATENK